MHPNPVFRQETTAENLGFASARGFGVVSINGSEGPLLAHIPFVITPDNRGIEMHLVRSNPIARALRDGPQQAVIAISGPDAYISPDWYGVDDQVPTWNYVAVHLRGMLELRPQEELRGIIDRLSAQMEARLEPKPIWRSDKMNPEALAKMMRQIVPLHMRITDIDGTWKLNQNKSAQARLGAANALSEGGFGVEIEQLSKLMTEVES